MSRSAVVLIGLVLSICTSDGAVTVARDRQGAKGQDGNRLYEQWKNFGFDANAEVILTLGGR